MISYKLRREEKNCGFGRILPAFTPQSYTILYNPIQRKALLYNTTNIMKKNYIAPQTEAIELLASNVLMASPGGGFVSPHVGWGGDGYNGSGN